MAPAEKRSDNKPSEINADKKPSDTKSEGKSNNASNSTDRPNANAEPGKPLAPPPKPGEAGDYFSNLSLEPNPFEQSFGGRGDTVETPGGTKLPSVAALTSPSSLLPGSGNTPFGWGGGSLKNGPLSPAMLSGPATNDYFGDTSHTLRGGFTPNESSLRTGLTPGGSGSMFPAASPGSQFMLQGGGATPSTLDFHRTAMNAAASKVTGRDQSGNHNYSQGATATTKEPESNGVTVKSEGKPASGQFDPHDNDAANGLFMLAQGGSQRSGADQQPQTHQGQQQHPAGGGKQATHAHSRPANPSVSASPQMNGSGSVPPRGVSETGSGISEESEPTKPATTTKGKAKRGPVAANGPPTANGRRKADEPPVAKQPASKKTKMAMPTEEDMSSDEDDDRENGSKSKMTDEEKRKNFLERNRVAALKCRQRKKQWLANLQNKVELFSSENDALTTQISQLREEVVNLKTLLLAHKDCPVTQQQGLHGGFMQQPMETYNPQLNPYGMGAPIPNQQVMAGQGVQRRFS